MDNTMVQRLRKYRWPILCGTYLIAHCTIMSSYTTISESTATTQMLAALQWLVPTLLLALLIPQLSRKLSPIVRAIPITYLGLLAVITCATLELCKVPGLWWSWSTIGLLALVVTLVYNLNRNRLGDLNSALLGVSAALIGIAIFEMLYQTGLLFYHDFFGSGTVNYMIVMAEQLTWIIPSLIIALVLWQRYGRTLRIGKDTAALAIVATLCTIVWFTDDMAIPLMWYKGVGPYITNADSTMIAISRCCQGCWCLAVATCFLPGRHSY